MVLSDKIGHLVLYGVLGAALAHGGARASRTPHHVGLILIGALYGGIDEWHQSFVPGRTASAADLLADVVGVALGYGLVVLWRRHRGAPAGTSAARHEKA